MPANQEKCKVCADVALEEIAEFRQLPRVTSDCVPFRAGGRLLICNACGAAQSLADEQWFQEIGEIYGAYQCYQQSGGVEQHVMDPDTGLLRQRSEVLLDRLILLPGFPSAGDILDVGCGGGSTLRAFAARGGWRLFGLEIDDHNLPVLRSIAGFDTLYTCEARDLPRRFDVITMVHALEHFPEPLDTLCDLRAKLAPGGRLFVEVPNADVNPYEYLVADHAVHFSPSTLTLLAARAAWQVDHLSTTWVAKELSLTALPGQAQPQPAASASDTISQIRAQIDWLCRSMDAARKASGEYPAFGLFGASIAATWLAGVLGDKVSFFVEEDTHRVGRTHMGRPILSPAGVPPGSVVYMALLPQIADRAAKRLAKTLTLQLPPPFDPRTAASLHSQGAHGAGTTVPA